MRIHHIIASSLLALAFGAQAGDEHNHGHEHGHEHQSLHGGIVTEAKDMDFELVAKPDQIALHVRDHGKPASAKGATAKLTLLNGAEKTSVTLSPAGGVDPIPWTVEGLIFKPLQRAVQARLQSFGSLALGSA